MTVSETGGINDRDLIATDILEQLLVPYQDESDSDVEFSIPLSDLCDTISDFPDDEIMDVIDEIVAEQTGVDFDNGDLVLTNRDRAKNYYSMCSPFG